MKTSALVVIFALHCALTSATPLFAQEDPATDESAVTTEVIDDTAAPEAPASLDIAPAGVATPDWQAMRDVAAAVPSPLGPAPVLVSADANGYGVSVKLWLDNQRNRYAYNCGGQRCTGFATDLWRALGPEQRQAYVDTVLDSIVSAAPGLHVYVVDVTGTAGNSLLARAIINEAGERRYASFTN